MITDESLICGEYCYYKEVQLKLVRQSQIMQSAIYGSDTVVTQVLTPALLSLGS